MDSEGGICPPSSGHWQPARNRAQPPHTWEHGRRMERKAKAKVVSSVWGTELIQVLAALVVFSSVDLKERLNSSFAFASVSILLLCCDHRRRIDTEEKAKVIFVGWWTYLNAALAN